MPCDDDGATGIAHAGGFVPIPALEVTVNQAARERVACAQNIIDFDGKTGDVEGRLSFLEDGCAFCAAFDDEGGGSQGKNVLNGRFQVPGDFRGGDLRVFDFELARIGKHRREDFFFRAECDIYISQNSAGVDPKGAYVMPLVGAEINVEENCRAASFRLFNSKKRRAAGGFFAQVRPCELEGATVFEGRGNNVVNRELNVRCVVAVEDEREFVRWFDSQDNSAAPRSGLAGDVTRFDAFIIQEIKDEIPNWVVTNSGEEGGFDVQALRAHGDIRR